MSKSFILFDFDGVIADSFKTAFAVSKMICSGLTHDLFMKAHERNINDNWVRLIDFHTEECHHDMDFFAEYIPMMKKEIQIVPGIKEVIVELEKEYALIIISSTPTNPIQEFLEKHDLAKHFIRVLGNDVHNSKIEKIKMVFDEYNIGEDDCVFVTDTLGDMREASAAGIGTIGVVWGFHKPETLLMGKPFCLLEKPEHLLMAVSDYFKMLK